MTMRASREEPARASVRTALLKVSPAEDEGPPQRLTYLVKQLQEAMRARLEHITQQFGLTPKQYTALERPGQTSGHLLRAPGPAHVRHASGRERDGRDAREQGIPEAFGREGNRRCLEVELTRAGTTALTGCNALVDQLERFVFRDVGPGRRGAVPSDAADLPRHDQRPDNPLMAEQPPGEAIRRRLRDGPPPTAFGQLESS